MRTASACSVCLTEIRQLPKRGPHRALLDLVRPGTEWEDPVPVIEKLLASYRPALGRQHHPLWAGSASGGLDGIARDYYVRQFQDWKGGADVDRLLVPRATVYARICGATLARAHARWGDRIAIASYLGQGDTFDRAIADFSAAYAEQNERDYATFAAAVNSGRLAARTGV